MPGWKRSALGSLKLIRRKSDEVGGDHIAWINGTRNDENCTILPQMAGSYRSLNWCGSVWTAEEMGSGWKFGTSEPGDHYVSQPGMLLGRIRNYPIRSEVIIHLAITPLENPRREISPEVSGNTLCPPIRGVTVPESSRLTSSQFGTTSAKTRRRAQISF